MAAHDVVGSARRLALGTAFAALVLLGLSGLVPRGWTGVLSLMSAFAILLGVVAAMSALISLLARRERTAVRDEMVGEIEKYLESQPPATHR
jgi:hypothetical protein